MHTAGSERVTIDATGVLDIASAKLEIAGAAGSADEVLKTDGSGNISWGAASGGGKILQVVSTTGTSAVTVNSTTYTSLVSVDITPAATTSKILLFATGDGNSGGGTAWNRVKFYRDSTAIGNHIIYQASGTSENHAWALHTLDSPSSTSQITFSIRAQRGSGDLTYGEEGGGQSPTITAIEVGA
jgi:hypothetical protein